MIPEKVKEPSYINELEYQKRKKESMSKDDITQDELPIKLGKFLSFKYEIDGTEDTERLKDLKDLIKPSRLKSVLLVKCKKKSTLLEESKRQSAIFLKLLFEIDNIVLANIIKL